MLNSSWDEPDEKFDELVAQARLKSREERLRQRLQKIPFVRKDRNQLYVSLVMGVFSFTLSFMGQSPGYYEILLITGSSLIGFFCALNAFVDTERMNSFERAVASLWFFPMAFWAFFHVVSAFFWTPSPFGRA